MNLEKYSDRYTLTLKKKKKTYYAHIFKNKTLITNILLHTF